MRSVSFTFPSLPCAAGLVLVQDQLAALGARPVETLTPEQARRQPTPADAVTALLQRLRRGFGT